MRPIMAYLPRLVQPQAPFWHLPEQHLLLLLHALPGIAQNPNASSPTDPAVAT